MALRHPVRRETVWRDGPARVGVVFVSVPEPKPMDDPLPPWMPQPPEVELPIDPDPPSSGETYAQFVQKDYPAWPIYPPMPFTVRQSPNYKNRKGDGGGGGV